MAGMLTSSPIGYSQSTLGEEFSSIPFPHKSLEVIKTQLQWKLFNASAHIYKQLS
jgi:hypothetical protein